MKKLIIPALIVALALTVVQTTASAAPGSASGPSALALAAVMAPHSRAVRAFDKRVIARLFRGNTNFGFTPNTKISVDAESVTCRVSNVDITSRSCELNFGARKRTLTGREANEVGAWQPPAFPPRELLRSDWTWRSMFFRCTGSMQRERRFCASSFGVRRFWRSSVDCRPTMRFVPVKTADQQAAVLLHRGRERLVRQRTGLIAIVRDEGDARLPCRPSELVGQNELIA